jgi:hypothetical protein
MTTARERLPDRFVLFWDQRLVQMMGGRPWLAAAVVVAILFSSFYLLALATGIYDLIDGGNIPEIALTFGVDPYTWAAFVTSLLTGFAVCASSWAVVHEEEDLKEAAQVVARQPDELAGEWLEFQTDRVHRGLFFGATLYVIGFLVVVFNIPGAADLLRLKQGPLLPWFQQAPAAWFLVVVPINFAIIGKSGYFTISDERFMRDLRAAHLKIDLFHPEKLAPFNRMALRRCFLWSIGSSIGLLFFLNAAIEPSGLAPFLFGIVAVAFATLFTPLIGMHKKIVDVKNRELNEVRTLIVELKSQLMGDASIGTDVAQRLTGIIAYEARLEKTPEWPIDLPTIGKFSLYMGIPVFSWVGGALVERVVDSLI